MAEQPAPAVDSDVVDSDADDSDLDDDGSAIHSSRARLSRRAGHGPVESWSPPVLIERVRMWATWIGPGRLAGTAGALLVMAGIGWWLLRSPALPTEAALPVVSHNGTAPSSAVGSSTTTTSGVAAMAPASPAASVLVVHVTGAVNRPGVYELTTGQRVDDALAAAGGPTPDAEADSLNLAAPVIDGDRIEVPVAGQVLAGAAVTPGAGHIHAADLSVEDSAVSVDVNQADAVALDELPGVGPATAAAIVDYRGRNGPFASIDQLLEVPGIGPAKLSALRDLVTT